MWLEVKWVGSDIFHNHWFPTADPNWSDEEIHEYLVSRCGTIIKDWGRIGTKRLLGKE